MCNQYYFSRVIRAEFGDTVTYSATCSPADDMLHPSCTAATVTYRASGRSQSDTSIVHVLATTSVTVRWLATGFGDMKSAYRMLMSEPSDDFYEMCEEKLPRIQFSQETKKVYCGRRPGRIEDRQLVPLSKTALCHEPWIF